MTYQKYEKFKNLEEKDIKSKFYIYRLDILNYALKNNLKHYKVNEIKYRKALLSMPNVNNEKELLVWLESFQSISPSNNYGLFTSEKQYHELNKILKKRKIDINRLRLIVNEKLQLKEKRNHLKQFQVDLENINNTIIWLNYLPFQLETVNDGTLEKLSTREKDILYSDSK